MALFKIFGNFASGNTTLPTSATQGFCYFDKNTGKFYIDTTNAVSGRMALNAEKETQQNQNASGDYRILLSGNANDTTEIAYINKNTNLRFNPGTQLLSVGGSISATGDLIITGDTDLNGETFTESITTNSLLVNGNTNFVQIPTAPTPANDSNDTSIATTAFVMNAFTANDAMIFKGTIGTGGTVTALPATHKQGWTYRVITAGTYAGKVCEIGDMIICVTDGTAASNDHWTVVQTNIDGAVTGPTSATANAIAIFNGTTGKVIKDSAKTITTATPASGSTSATIPTSNAVWAAITGASGYGKVGTVTSVQVQATSPVVSSTSTSQTGSLNTTISLANNYGDTKNPYAAKTANYVLAGPTSGSNAVPTFRKLVGSDIPIATSTAIGGIKVGFSTTGQNYAIELDSSNNAYVNVPWTDTLVKQNSVTANHDYRLLFTTTNSPISGNANEVGYDDSITINPSTKYSPLFVDKAYKDSLGNTLYSSYSLLHDTYGGWTNITPGSVSVDLNTKIVAGNYYFTTMSTGNIASGLKVITNAPIGASPVSGTNPGFLKIYTINNKIYQIFIAKDENLVVGQDEKLLKVFIRVKIGDNWSSWRELTQEIPENYYSNHILHSYPDFSNETTPNENFWETDQDYQNFLYEMLFELGLNYDEEESESSHITIQEFINKLYQNYITEIIQIKDLGLFYDISNDGYPQHYLTGDPEDDYQVATKHYVDTSSAGLELPYYSSNALTPFYIKTDLKANEYSTMIYGYIIGNGYSQKDPIRVDFQAYNYDATDILSAKQYDATNAIGNISIIRADNNLIYFKVTPGGQFQTFKIFIYKHNNNNSKNYAVSTTTTAPTIEKEVVLTKVYGINSNQITNTAPSASSTSATIPSSTAVWAAISGASGYGKVGTVTSVRVQATSPIVSSSSAAQTSSLNTTISLAKTTANYVIAGPSSGSTTAVPTYRKLVAADIPDLSSTYSTTDTKNTAGSTNSTSKTYLVGALEQSANPQTYSHTAVYATEGAMAATSYKVAEAVTLVYDATTQALNFVFA